MYSDFNDKGEALKALELKLNNFNSGIFVSPIDKILHIIESTRRPANDKHGEGSRFLRIAEVSGRRRRLIKEGDKWVLRSLNYKADESEEAREEDEKNAFKKFDGFNNGRFDALLINEVGSTGASAQASKDYKDSRPRSMIIHQVELDVNTEVQKRGRINRTGQICLPTYTYLTSPIPSEIRRLMMLKRKLRGLDSLTTGSQKQSDELVTFRNKRGEEIQDFYNYIGLEVLTNWLESSEAEFKGITYNRFFYDNADHVAIRNREDNAEKFVDDFCRIMELADCEMQEYFYDSINTLYIEKEKELIESDNYLLATTIENYDASVKAKKETKFGMNTSPFNESVYDEENYIFQKNIPYTKEQAQSLVNQLCLGKTPEEYQKSLIADYKKEFGEYVTNLVAEYPMPVRKDFKSKEEFEKAVAEVEAKKTERVIRETEHSEKVLQILDRYRPNQDYIVPDITDFGIWLEEYAGKNNGAKPDPNKEPSLIRKCKSYLGKFLGYNINSKSKFKYSGGSIEMIFGFISEVKKITLKPTTLFMFDMLQWIPIRTSMMLDEERVRIDEWEVEKEKRTVGRFLTGNVIDALRIAEARKKQGIITSYKYIKFTTSEGDIRNAVSLRFADYVPLRVDDIQTSVPCVNRIFERAIEDFKCEGKVCDYALSMNSGYTERFLAISSRDSEGNPITLVKLVIIGEKLKHDAKNNTYKPVERGEKYKSKFFNDENLKRFIKSNPIKSIKQYPDYTLAKKDLQYFTVEEYLFSDNSDKKGLYNYLDEIAKLAFQFRTGASSPEDIKFRPDPIKESDSSEREKKEDREEGEFEYFNIEQYNPEDKNIPYYKSHRAGEFQWIITTSKILKPLEAITFSLNPLNLSEKQMANMFFSKFTPREFADFKEKIEEIYNRSKNYLLVGLEVSKIGKQKYGSSNYIFGKLAKSPNVLGELIYQYISSDEIKLKTTEQEAKEVKKEEYKVEIKQINQSNIEDYLILINA